MKIKNKPYSKAQSPEKSVSTTSKTIKYNNYAVNVGSQMLHNFFYSKTCWCGLQSWSRSRSFLISWSRSRVKMEWVHNTSVAR